MLTSHQKLGLIILAAASFVVTFLAGLGVGRMSTAPIIPSVSPTPGLQPTFAPSNINVVPGYQYYSDGFYILAKDDPTLGLVVSVDRHQDQTSYNQSTRITYFNPTKPVRYTTGSATSNLSIQPDKYITNWQTTIDPSRVLKEQSVIELNLPDAAISISTSDLANETLIRSLPSYTKFFSNGEAKLTVNGVNHPANIMYYHLNSNNASDIYFYTKPLGITTHLLVFWNQAGEAYLLDMTDVSRPIPLYTSHKIGFFIDANKTVSRTFTPTVVADKALPPKDYDISFPSPINSQLTLSRTTTMSKSVNEDWYLSTVTGKITRDGVSTSGTGLIEYIHDN